MSSSFLCQLTMLIQLLPGFCIPQNECITDTKKVNKDWNFFGAEDSFWSNCIQQSVSKKLEQQNQELCSNCDYFNK